MQARGVGPAARQAEVHLARGDLALDAPGVVVAEIQAHGRILRREPGGGRGDDLRDRRWRGRHADAPALQRAKAHHVLDHPVEVRQQPHDARQELLAGGGQQHAPAGAGEELGAQRVLQLAHQAGHGRLRLEQALGRMREAGFLRHRHKGGQVLQSDVLGQTIHFKTR
ncbi:hypothetical protein D3C86_1181570 [compost metagenome]